MIQWKIDENFSKFSRKTKKIADTLCVPDGGPDFANKGGFAKNFKNIILSDPLVIPEYETHMLHSSQLAVINPITMTGLNPVPYLSALLLL